MHHVYARGVDKMALFRDDGDRRRYLALLAHAVAEYAWSCLSYCLMDNHVHLLIKTLKPNLGRGMQRLHGDYGRTFNHRHDRDGHVFQGRYGSKRIMSDDQLWACVAYIARNPVEAGMVAGPEAWPWSSSHRATLRDQAPRWLDDAELLAYMSAAIGSGDARRSYAELVAGRRG